MTEPITKQELIDASQDALTLEQVVNGDDVTDVTSRLARTYPTLAKALRLIVQNGLLGATPFNLKSSMDASGLVNDDYAVVTDDPVSENNGFYQKRAGVFEFLAWNPINQFLTSLAAETADRIAADTLINTTIAQLVVDRMIGVKDSAGRYALAITKTGRIYAPNLVLPSWVTATLTSLAGADSAEQAARIAADAVLTSAQTTTASNLAAFISNFSVNVGVHDDSGNKYLFALINKTQGRIAFGITRKAELMIGGAKVRADRLPFVVLDYANRAAISVTKSGKVRIPNLVLSSSLLTQIIDALPPIGAATKAEPLANAVWAEINHVVGYGQSLSRGATTTTPISVTQPYSNIMFASGVKIKPYESGYDVSSFVPLIETVTAPDGTNAESPTSGYLNEFSRRIELDGLLASDYVMLGTQSGRGGHAVDELSEDDRFINLEAHIQAAKALADAAEQSYAVTAITWIQGESDIAAGLPPTSYVDYYQRCCALFDRIRKLAIDTSGQEFSPWIFTYQTSGHLSYNKTELKVARAQWSLSTQQPTIVMAAPAYGCPHTVDNVHLNQEGSWLLGAYFGRALWWTLIKGIKWRPLEPIDVTWTATHVDVKYHVPCKPIQISTLICTATHNSGYDIWTDAGVLISDAIDSVTVLSDDTIRITFDPLVSIPTDVTLCYGRGRAGDPQSSGPVNGARGNIMDSHGLYDKVTAPTSTVFDLYNVGVMFQHSPKNGF